MPCKFTGALLGEGARKYQRCDCGKHLWPVWQHPNRRVVVVNGSTRITVASSRRVLLTEYLATRRWQRIWCLVSWAVCLSILLGSFLVFPLPPPSR